MDTTPRFALPYLSPGQAQKELFHNEALQILDMVVAPAVDGGPLAAPPPNPQTGSCFLVSPQPSGDWTGMADCLAAWTAGGWRFVQAREGLAVYIRPDGIWAVYRSGRWENGVVRATSISIGDQQVVGAQRPAIGLPAGGTTVDAEGRSAIAQILDALRQHGLIAT